MYVEKIIKPLEWVQVSERVIEAAGHGCTYRIMTYADGTARLSTGLFGEGTPCAATVIAKIVAEESYREQVARRLDDVPVAALIEAIRAMQNNETIRAICPSPLWGKMADALAPFEANNTRRTS